MSTVVRRKRTSRLEIGPYKRHELLTGELRYPVYGYTGYGDGVSRDLTALVGGQMRADWTNNRDELMAFWKSGEYTDELPWLFARGFPDTLPWAALHLDKG